MLGERLKKLRKERNLTQIQLAAELNVANATIAMWETNKRTPDLKTVHRLADFFGVTTDYLAGESLDQIHYSGLVDIYHRGIVIRSNDKLFSDEEILQE